MDHLSRKEIEQLEEERRRNDGYEVVNQDDDQLVDSRRIKV